MRLPSNRQPCISNLRLSARCTDYFDPLTFGKNRYRMISSDTAVRLPDAVVSLVDEGR